MRRSSPGRADQPAPIDHLERFNAEYTLQKVLEPISKNLKSNGFLQRVQDAIEQGSFAVDPRILCFPVLGHDLQRTPLLKLLTDGPASELTLPELADIRGIIAAGGHPGKPAACVACGTDWCILPEHIHPYVDGRDSGRDQCLRHAARLRQTGNDIPLLCNSHSPPCLTGSASIPLEQHIIGCWLYYSGYASLKDMPLREVYGLLDSPTTATMRLPLYKIHSDNGKSCLRLINALTLREHFASQLASTRDTASYQIAPRPADLDVDANSGVEVDVNSDVDVDTISSMDAANSDPA